MPPRLQTSARLALCLLPLACHVSPRIHEGSGDAAFVGSAACTTCHPTASDAWRRSQHAAAMQPATSATVLGDFNDATFTAGGFTSRFFRRDARFFVNTLGADGAAHDYEILFTFGLAPLQQYLVAFPRGRLQPLTLAWDTRTPAQGGARWFALDAIAPHGIDDQQHWTGRETNWNFMCADCHATGVRKRYVEATDSFDTQYSELGVGCEGCHGPGAAHLRWSRTPRWLRGLRWSDNGLAVALDERRGVGWRTDSATGLPQRSAPRRTDRELQVCAQCHAARVHIADGYTAGASLMDYYDPLLLMPGSYYPDGQQLDEVYDYGSFLESRMHAAGVTCSDCHEPHTQKLRNGQSQVCLQCHRAATCETSGHHGHARRSAGSACAACHMPVTTYMQIDGRHDHSIRIPRPDRSARLQVPDPCTSCHTGRSAAWAAAAVQRWGGKGALGFQQFADAFAADEADADGAAAQLVALARDATNPAIVRASALARLARYPGPSTRGVAAEGARDRDPLVRRGALEALEGEVPAERVAIAAPLLSDSLRAIRWKAAWLLATLGDSLPTPAWRAAFARADTEFVASQRYNADRAEHRVTLGAYLVARGDTAAGADEVRAVLRLGPRDVMARVDLAGVLSLQGRERDAEALLRAGVGASPDESELHFALGLSLARQGRIVEGMAAVARALRLEPGDARYARAYAALEEARRE
ncbi:MAG: tetratricopeptide repeat protein [Gemmatimonadaceae bacterium]|nr:tetratricopeptide repeat protein [Gemmatimonadaceae bacterium]